MAKNLIIGATGFLGSHLHKLLYSSQSFNRPQLDLSKKIPTKLFKEKYDYVIICAAASDVEFCAKNHTLSEQINVIGTMELLDQIQLLNAIPIFFSSDYVFGNYAKESKEDDPKNPSTIYGKQKLIIEKYIQHNFEKYLIFRTSKLMSQTKHKKNILYPLIENLKLSKSVQCFEDQWINPVFVEDIASVIKIAIENKKTGTFHLGTKKIYTRYELGLYLAKLLNLNSKLIFPNKLSDCTFLEKRPQYNTLNCNLAEEIFEFKFTEIEQLTGNHVLFN